jgi:hypothetical protein
MYWFIDKRILIVDTEYNIILQSLADVERTLLIRTIIFKAKYIRMHDMAEIILSPGSHFNR